MYTVTLQNFASVPREFLLYDCALKHAKSIGFETCIWSTHPGLESILVASYSPLYGLRVHDRLLAGMAPGLTLADAIAINGVPVAR